MSGQVAGNLRQPSPAPAGGGFGGGPPGGGMGNGMMGGGGGAPGGGSPQVDGKAFFRQARGKLSNEAFNQFLASIKRLNSQQQTREETLDEARRLFGPDNSELYMDFESL